MIEVVATDEFVDWYDTVSIDEAVAIQRAINHLELGGASLGDPYESGCVGTNFQLRHLRLRAAERELSLCFAIDLIRKAAIVLAGANSGVEDICRRYVDRVEELWHAYARDIPPED